MAQWKVGDWLSASCIITNNYILGKAVIMMSLLDGACSVGCAAKVMTPDGVQNLLLICMVTQIEANHGIVGIRHQRHADTIGITATVVHIEVQHEGRDEVQHQIEVLFSDTTRGIEDEY